LLDSMRAASQTWFGRIVMGLIMCFIALSFMVWGIGDIFQGFSSKDLAKVGGSAITVDAYRNAYQFEMQRLQQQLKRAVTNDEARAFGIDRQVLSRLISEATLDEKAKELGLAISDRRIAESIVRDETFKDASGKFDKLRFDAILRENGFTERTFVAQQRDVYLRREIAQSVTANLDVPDALIEAIHRFQNETRSIDYVVLPPSSAGQIAEPTKEELEAYYQAHQQSYQTPEYRKVVMLAVSPAKIAGAEKISDEDLQKRYEETKEQRFTAPETRTIEQIPYPDEATALAARSQIDSGKTFQDLAKEKNLSQTDIDLGTVTQASLVDQAVGDAAFALPEGAVSQPVKSRFGSVLLHVTKINPAKTQPFSEVSGLIAQELSVLRARNSAAKLRDQIEDQRSSGKSLAEAAKSAGLEPQIIEAVDSTGHDKSGKFISDVASDQALLKAIFTSDVGVDNDTIATKDGGTIWFEIEGIDPAREQSLDEVKAQVEKGWKDDETDKKLSEKAADWIAKLKTGETLQKLAEESSLEVKHADGIKRGGGAALSQSAVAQVFNVPVKGFESATERAGRIVFQVQSSTVPPLDKSAPELKSLTDQVQTSLGNEVLGEYLAGLQKTYGLRIYQSPGAAIGSANNY